MINMKMQKILVIGIALMLLIADGCIPESEPEGDSTPETAIKVASFNIQVFGRTKREKDDVMNILVRIVREFDVMLVQEIRDSSETTAQFYLDKINAMDGPDYAFVKSARLGRTSSKEAYAYFYNTDTVDFIEGSDYVFDDTLDGEDDFEREPYIASFRSGNFDFTLVGIHTKPDDAEHEISELKVVFDSVLTDSERDVIIMGDFNADGSYFDEDGTSPLKAEGFSWVITNDMDTMTKTNWTYDRIVMTDATLKHEYMDGSAAVFYFDDIYSIDDQELVGDVSDHFPVYAVFRTGLTDDD